MDFYDFNIIEQKTFQLIPAETLAKVVLKIKAGGYRDEARGCSDGYPTRSFTSGAIYLDCEFTVLDGKYMGRKIWQLIGLYSDKNDNIWGNIGRYFIRSIINSCKGFKDSDDSAEAQKARKITSFAQLNGLEFVAKIGLEKDNFANEKNIIKKAIGPEHRDYERLMAPVVKPIWA